MRKVTYGAAVSLDGYIAGPEESGFDLLLGNPPWVRLQRVPAQLRRRFRESFEVFRAACWDAGAKAGGASKGFASQVDLAALFVAVSALLDDEEALAEARRALAEALADYAEEGIAAPSPTARAAVTIEAAPVARPIPA